MGNYSRFNDSIFQLRLDLIHVRHQQFNIWFVDDQDPDSPIFDK